MKFRTVTTWLYMFTFQSIQLFPNTYFPFNVNTILNSIQPYIRSNYISAFVWTHPGFWCFILSGVLVLWICWYKVLQNPFFLNSWKQSSAVFLHWVDISSFGIVFILNFATMQFRFLHCFSQWIVFSQKHTRNISFFFLYMCGNRTHR